MSKKKRQPLYGLSKGNTPRKARDMLDMDYVATLSEADKLWLDKFCREYYQCTLRRDGTDMHSADEQRRSLYGDNNARQRDMWNQFVRDHDDMRGFSGTVDGEDDE